MSDKKDRGKVGVPSGAPAAPTPFPPGTIDMLRKAHQPSTDSSIGGEEVCGECSRLWPCTISRLLTMIEVHTTVERRMLQ